MSQDKQAILSRWFKVGEEIPLDNQRTGVVISFDKTYIGRGGFDYQHAGIYLNFLKPLIVFKENSWEPRFLSCVGVKKECENRGVTIEELEKLKVKIGDLPDTPFWEGDEVFNKFGSKLHIAKIIYKDNPSHILYQEDGGSEATEIAFSLSQRGNIWKLTHGAPLDFASIDEEAKFYQSLGMSQKVQSTSEDGLWSLTAAIEAIHRGEGDQMKLKDKQKLSFIVIKYDNEEFGERMRTHILTQFLDIEN